MTQSNLIKRIKQYFSNKPEIAAAYLYGSYARGEQKEDSDIDIAILLNSSVKNTFDIQIQHQNNIEKLLKKKVEVQAINSSRVDFSYRVISEGIIIHGYNNPFRVDFEVKTMQNYFDLMPFFKEYYEVLREQCLKGDFYA
ncbi:hypothetical protein A3D77_01320 [Candidatus Gottesmanbacteria bacterium RIFCSPHIGHO2_02_FULL_39_11]|uniref:Polymerase beta nucleotidyltransferase domain-containing protein n=1 Tax=Candidatus Gottesmanbacteria bacterium RIFCSPHIGHO2_02_FULL_39_11 TaxID=1798382 RepID=A0A1F5ZT49_9BACT|nr:MAG: hypothetical protein A3D77_01320 [Candidatus Gottesmanbacteria bacterium RIFCSPHIGHO2_02_FULL_39_11]